MSWKPRCHCLEIRAQGDPGALCTKCADILRAAASQAHETLRAFRSYYITDNRLGLDPGANPEVQRADKSLADLNAALAQAAGEAK